MGVSIRRLRRLTTVVAAALGTVALAACGSEDDASTSAATAAAGTTAAAPAQEEVGVALFIASLGDGYTRAVFESVEETAAEMGATVKTFNAEYDPQKQQQQCQDAIVTQKYQAFVIHSVDGPSMVNCVRAAVDAGIKVAAIGSPIGPDVDTTEPQVEGIVGTVLESPSTMGKALAELTVEACADRDPCKVIYEFGPPEFSFAANVRSTFRDLIAEHPSIEIVAEGSHHFVPDEARTLTQQLLQAHGDAHVITSDDDPAAVALLGVVEDMGKDIAVIGGAGAREAADLVAEGKMFGSAVMVPRSEARAGTEMVIKAARGEDPGETQINNAEDLSPVGPKLTADNVADFDAEWSMGG
jgi:ribose transport system substrate-binding protein